MRCLPTFDRPSGAVSGKGRKLAWIALACAACGDPVELPTAPRTAEPHCEQPVAHPLDDTLTLYDVQMKSTHNSYHVEPEGNDLDAWAYSHAPLDVQLDEQGVRHFELDIQRNADTGRFEVFHVLTLDEETTCRLFTDCLETLRDWSEAHPGHHTIFVHVEPKPLLPGDPEAELERLHRAITSVWAPSCIVTPDEVRGDHATLREALDAGGWPTLGDSRGKILFTMLDRGDWREAYTRGGTTVEGRLMFAEGGVSDPFAAVGRVDDPIAGADDIDAQLAAQMIVRTRADANGVEPLEGDTSRKEAALESGAQMVSTDYPAPVEAHDYWLDMPGGTPSRCNPVTAPSDCAPEDIEDPALLEGP